MIHKSETTITQERKCLILKKVGVGKVKKARRKRIPEISDRQAKNYKSMGVAEGQDLFHCIYLASKYAKDFDERVAAYMIVKPTPKGCSFAVKFFEKKKVLNRLS